MKKGKQTKALKRAVKDPDDEDITDQLPDFVEPKKGLTVAMFIKRLKKK
ncbi:MAG: hypothetical protein HY758_09710 [Nitrospirae bacterium]|nr:hypothetical protein [Nitrospirota bacterium]